MYEGGSARPLREYLLERYAYGRGEGWRESFYPNRVRLNGARVDEGTVVEPGGRLDYLHLRGEEPPPPALAPPLYEDRWMLVLHKPDCVPVNPSGLYYFTCLALLAREAHGNPELSPVHRLDLETSGPLIFSKRKADRSAFHRLFQDKTIRKFYRALVHGAFPQALREISGRIVPHPASAIATKLCLDPEGGPEHSLTRILGVRRRASFSELELEPVTGKTNQLRVHLAAVGTPIVGDKKYHPDEGVFLDWLAHRDYARLRSALLLPRQALQSEALEFSHPFTGERLRVEAPPGSWAAKLAGLGDGA